MLSNKKFVFLVIILFCIASICVMLFNFIIDPFFLYRKPFDALSYKLESQRYQNNGIARHFEYDAIITGTSMTENFKASQFDDLFKTNSIKTSFSGATFNEIALYLNRAISYNPNIEIIVMSLDQYNIMKEKDALPYRSYPEYLYDENYFNDISYLLNKHTFIYGSGLTIFNTLIGNETTSFDDYSRWQEKVTFSEEVLLNSYNANEKTESSQKQLLEEDRIIIFDNLQQNLIQLAIDNPDIEFYCFFPPYSIVYYGNLNQSNTLNYHLNALKYASELIVEYDNIKLFSFLDLYDVTTNYALYKDETHYSEEINDDIFKYMEKQQHLITSENIDEHFDDVFDFYLNYDYGSILK